MGIDYVREYLPFLPHTATLVAMYTCVGVVAVLFIWGLRAPLPPLPRRRRRGLWTAVNGKVLPWGPRLCADAPRRSRCRPRSRSAACRRRCTCPSSTARCCSSSGPRIVAGLRGRPPLVRRVLASRARSTWCSRPSSMRRASRWSSASSSPSGPALRRAAGAPAAEALHHARALRPPVHGRSPGSCSRGTASPRRPPTTGPRRRSSATALSGLLRRRPSGSARRHRVPGALVDARRRRLQPDRRPGLDRVLALCSWCPGRWPRTTRAAADEAHDPVRPDRRDGVRRRRRGRRRHGDHGGHRPRPRSSPPTPA